MICFNNVQYNSHASEVDELQTKGSKGMVEMPMVGIMTAKQ